MIKADNIWFSYTGGDPYVLRGLNFAIDAGEYVSVVGDNGSGKSTLMRLILGLLRPTRGVVKLGAKSVGYVPQRRDFSSSAFPLTVSEMLRSYARLRGVDYKREVGETLRLTGTEPYKNALVGSLSGGQSQKILIARALIGTPELLVFDEPSTGIDANSAAEIYALMRRLRERGVTVVSVEHNLAAAMESSTHIYHLSNGSGHICTPAQYAHEFLGRELQ